MSARSASVGEDGREVWEVPDSVGAWGGPWSQCIELAQHLPSTSWSLVGGLMVHLHAAVAEIDVARATEDVDILVHIEVPDVSIGSVRAVLTRLDYALQASIDETSPAHRFVRRSRGREEQIDVLIADHAAPRAVPTLHGRRLVRAPGGTQALQRTVNCRISLPRGESAMISTPNTLGALVLKGAAYREDSRDKSRHLDDAVVLLATVGDPMAMAAEMRGTDRSRIRAVQTGLKQNENSWLLLAEEQRRNGQLALEILAADPPNS